MADVGVPGVRIPASARTYHSMASSMPSPFNAEVLNIAHARFFSADSPSAFETSAADLTKRRESNDHVSKPLDQKNGCEAPPTSQQVGSGVAP